MEGTVLGSLVTAAHCSASPLYIILVYMYSYISDWCDRHCFGSLVTAAQCSAAPLYICTYTFQTGVEGIVFGVGNSLSLLCLSITLLTFCTFKPLRTVRGLAVMNLCVALFSAKLSFLVNFFCLTNISQIFPQKM